MDILKNCDEDGNVFIDRDGRMFYYILGFLRTGELCLPEDFSDFDSLTKEVNFFDIPELTSCLERAKHKKLLPLPVFKYIEISETRMNGSVGVVLKGRKEDLDKLTSTTFQSTPSFRSSDRENVSYVEQFFYERNARLQLAEVLSRYKWTCESSDFLFSYPPLEKNSLLYIEHFFRDRWKKSI